MAYDFRNLSYLDFEDLARDLVGRELGCRFEAFCPGPDGGIDGRNASAASGTVILQAKHYAGSSFSDLKAAMRRSRSAIGSLGPDRYVLVTSCGFTPGGKGELAQLIGPVLRNEDDILGPEDLNGLLRKYPDIEQANIKLWLSSAAVLDRMVNAANHVVTALSRGEIEDKVRVYAPNPSFREARDKLESGHVVIISGPPGVGKTTLAEMLSFAYIVEGWEYVVVRSLDDGFAKLHDTQRQIFFFDDFLGTAALDTRALAAKDSDLARFIKRVRTSSNARFVLTTRAPIFEEARRVSERLADKSLDIVKYVLDVGLYTRRIKARILYNHLLVSNISFDHIRALWSSGAVPRIVDHKNYNPRIIEAMTDGVQVGGVGADDYPAEFIKSLNNPQRIWDVSFRSHIPRKCQHLLYSLFFCSDYGVLIDELRVIFNGLHQFVSSKYAVPHDSSDFEESLRILEGGYIAIRDRRVSFINPSLRDYLSDRLDDVDLICDFASAAQKADWASRLWDYVRIDKLWSPQRHTQVARCFLPLATRFHELPGWTPSRTTPDAWEYHDMGDAERISLLLTWRACSGDAQFEQLALALATQRVGHFDAWGDGRRLVKLLLELSDQQDDYSLDDRPALVDRLEEGLTEMLGGHMMPDDLESIWDEIDARRTSFSPRVADAARDAIAEHIRDVQSFVEGLNSESELRDHINTIERFGRRFAIPDDELKRAISVIHERIAEIGEEAETAPSPSRSSMPTPERESFDDGDLANLFAPLVHGLE